MKSKSTLRNLLALIGSSLLAMSYTHAADTLTWDTAPGTVGAGDSTVTGGAGTWSTDTANGNWTADAGANNIAWVNDILDADTAIFGSTAGAITLGTDITAGGLTFNTNGYSISAGNTLTLSGATAPVISVTTGTTTIASDIAGDDGLEKTGAGTVVLSGTNNTYSGGTTISAGTLQGRKDTEGGASPFGTGTIQLNGGTLGLRTLGDGGNSAQTITFGNDVTVGGDATINFARIGGTASNKTHALGDLSIGSNTLTITGNNIGHFLSFTGANLSGDAVINTSTGTYIIANMGAITETGGPRDLTKQGLGTLRLLGTNNYTGTTTISGGILEVQGSIASSSGIINNSTLTFNSSSAQSYGNEISGSGPLTKTGAGTTTLSGNNSFTGVTTVSGGILEVTNLANGGSNSSIGASSSNPNNLRLSSGTTLRHTGATASSTDRNLALLGSATLDSSGTGTLTLGQAGVALSPDYSEDASAVWSTTNQKKITDLADTSTLAVGMRVTGTGIANNTTITSIDSATQVTVNNNFSATGGGAVNFGYPTARTLTLTGSNTGANTIAGNLQNSTATGSGVLSLTKTGAGTWVLSAANAYTGATTVSEGTLAITGASQATSAITFTGGSLGLDTGFPVTASSASVDLTNGTIKVTGSTGASSYTLLTAASITGVPVLAASVPGYELQVIDGATDELRLVNTGGASAYDTWSGGAAFGDDANGDGVSNGLAFLLGAANPNVSALDKLPTVTQSAGGLVLTFQMLNDTANGDATLAIEHSNTLANGSWTAVQVPYSSGTLGDIGFNITGTGPLDVTATIPVGKAAGGKLFGRLKAVNP